MSIWSERLALPNSKMHLQAVLFLTALLLVVMWNISLRGADPNDAGSGGDAGNLRELACVLATAGTWSGSVDREDEDDWYVIELEQGAILSVTLDVPDSADLDLYIYPHGSGSTGKLIRTAEGLGIDEVVERYAVEEAGRCYLQVHLHRVQRPYDRICTYELRIESQTQDDAGTGTDASNARSGADVALLPGTYAGTLVHSDDEDWYTVDCLAGQLLTAWLVYPLDADFHLVSPMSPWIRRESEQEEACRYVVTQDAPHIGVARKEGGGDYELRIEVDNQDDAGTRGDAFPLGHASQHVDSQSVSYGGLSSPTRSEDEVLLIHPGDYTGFLACGDEADWYAVEMYGNDTLVLDLSVPEGARMRLRLFRPGGQQPCDGGIYGSGDHVSAIDRFVARSGKWFFEVGLIEGAGTYAFALGREYGEGGIGLGGRAIIPQADGVSIPFLRKDPAVGSGSTCRGACGGGCPDTCQDRREIVRCVPDPNDENSHIFVSYFNVIECGTHAGCRQHDLCFDACFDAYGEESVVGPCHDACSAAIVKQYDPVRGGSWLLGYGPYDGYFLYSDAPKQSPTETGRLEYTEYRVDVYTGDLAWTFGEGTDARVYLTLIGTLFGTPRCSSAEIRLDTPDYNDFETDQHDSFLVTAEAFDTLNGIVLRHDNTGDFPGWYVDRVVITNLDSGASWRVDADRWLALDEEDNLLRVEIPTNEP